MAPTDRQTARDLADALLADARNYSFYRLVEHLHGLHQDNLESKAVNFSGKPRLILGNSARLSFPASDVAGATRQGDAARYRVQTTFLGLHGADSPLPGYYLDTAAYEYAQGKGIRAAFLDFFNHSLLELLHQGWRKYRYYVRYQHQATDHFSGYVFALIGINDADLRGASHIPWSRLLSYAGAIAGRSRAPATVAGIVAHCFDLDHVCIREFEVRSVCIAASQRNVVGRHANLLGKDFYIGGRTYSRCSKFTVVISELEQTRFRQLLPDGADYQSLRALVEFLLRDATAYDLELRLNQNQAPPFSLRRDNGTYLGWTSFIEGKARQQIPVVRIKVRS